MQSHQNEGTVPITETMPCRAVRTGSRIAAYHAPFGQTWNVQRWQPSSQALACSEQSARTTKSERHCTGTGREVHREWALLRVTGRAGGAQHVDRTHKACATRERERPQGDAKKQKEHVHGPQNSPLRRLR